MRLLIWFYFLVFLLQPSLGHSQGTKNTHKSGDEIYYQYDCNIINHEGELIRNFPGYMCVFYKNGDYITVDDQKVTYFDNSGMWLWHQKIHAHHAIISTKDEKYILVLSSDFKPFRNKTVRFDTILKFSRKGKLLKKWSSFENLELLKEKIDIDPETIPLASTEWMRTSTYKADEEYSHFNAIYEIPKNPIVKKIPAFQEGNFIVSMQGFGTLAIFDKNLKKILWRHKTSLFNVDYINGKIILQGNKYGIFNWGFHDAQILPNGNITYFLNTSIATSDNKKQFSSLVEVDPISETKIWKYTAQPPESFFAFGKGSIQFLADNTILYSDDAGHASIIDRDGNKLWSFTNPEKDTNKNSAKEFMRIRRVDLRSFLKKNLL